MRLKLTGRLSFVVADLISKVIPFLMLPYLTSSLGMTGFGELSLFHAAVGGFLVLLNLGFDSALSRYYIRYGKRSYLSLLFLCVASVVLVGFTSIIILVIFQLSSLFILALLYAALYSIQAIFLSYFVVSKKVLLYWALCLSSSLLSAILTVILYELVQPSVYLRAWSLLLGMFLLLPIIAFYFIKRGSGRSFVYKPQVYYLFMLCLPVLPHNASVFLRAYADRFFIDSYYGMLDLGVYSLAVQLSSIGLLFLQSMYKAYLPFLFEKLKVGVEYSKLRFAVIMLFIGLSLLSFVVYFLVLNLPSSLYLYFFGEGAEGVGQYLAVMSIGVVWQVMYLLLGGILIYLAEAAYVAVISIFIGLLHVSLLFVFIDTSVFSAAIIYLVTLFVFMFLMLKKVRFRWENERL